MAPSPEQLRKALSLDEWHWKPDPKEFVLTSQHGPRSWWDMHRNKKLRYKLLKQLDDLLKELTLRFDIQINDYIEEQHAAKQHEGRPHIGGVEQDWKISALGGEMERRPHHPLVRGHREKLKELDDAQVQHQKGHNYLLYNGRTPLFIHMYRLLSSFGLGLSMPLHALADTWYESVSSEFDHWYDHIQEVYYQKRAEQRAEQWKEWEEKWEDIESLPDDDSVEEDEEIVLVGHRYYRLRDPKVLRLIEEREERIGWTLEEGSSPWEQAKYKSDLFSEWSAWRGFRFSRGEIRWKLHFSSS